MRLLLAIFFLFSTGLSFSQTELVLERVDGLRSDDRIEDIEIENNRVWIASRNGIYAFDNDDSSSDWL